MKKFLVILLIFAAVASVAGYILSVTASSVFAANALRGSGRIVSKTIDAPAFDAIDASRTVKVIVAKNTSGKISIEADDNVIDFVTVKAVKGTLRVTIDNSVKNFSNISVTVTVPANGTIRSLEASSASKIICETALAADRFSMSASSAASIEAAVKASRCALDLSSASKITAALDVDVCTINQSSASKATVSGSAKECVIDMSSASKLNAEKFAVVDCAVSTSSAAKADVFCTGTLRADASSGSKISYSGDCEVRADKSSGGRVSKN